MKSKRILAIAAGVMVSGALLGVAAATEHEPTDVYGGGEDDAVLVEYDEESGTLTLAIRGEDGEFPDCGSEEGGDGDVVDAEAPEGCFVVTVDGDPESLNHGKFVSAVAKALHPSLLPDGVKKGHIMRVVAKSKLGKDGGDDVEVDGEVDGDGADDGAENDAKADKEAAKAERKAERDAAKAERKAARDAAKAERKANKRTGPPDHAKANGNRNKG